MSKEQKPLERNFGEAEGRTWCRRAGYNWRCSHAEVWWQVTIARPRDDGEPVFTDGVMGTEQTNVDDAWRDAVTRWCKRNDVDLPWRPEPDLSTVAGCLDVLGMAATPEEACKAFDRAWHGDDA